MAPERLTQLLYDLTVRSVLQKSRKRDEIPYVGAFMLLHQEEKESEGCHLMVQWSERKPKGKPVLQGKREKMRVGTCYFQI